jgi:hypothetical protein
MPFFRIHIYQFLTRYQVLIFLWRVLLPLIFICVLPKAENLLQEFFMAEGIIRILCNIWSFRGPALLASRSAGLCVLAFMLEESLQELCMWYFF